MRADSNEVKHKMNAHIPTDSNFITEWLQELPRCEAPTLEALRRRESYGGASFTPKWGTMRQQQVLDKFVGFAQDYWSGVVRMQELLKKNDPKRFSDAACAGGVQCLRHPSRRDADAYYTWGNGDLHDTLSLNRGGDPPHISIEHQDAMRSELLHIFRSVDDSYHVAEFLILWR